MMCIDNPSLICENTNSMRMLFFQLQPMYTIFWDDPCISQKQATLYRSLTHNENDMIKALIVKYS